MAKRRNSKVSRAKAKTVSKEKSPEKHESVPVNVTTNPVKDLIVVGIGASAGGLDPLRDLVGGLPVDTGMAFILVQHQSIDHKSLLAEILQKLTPMRVTEAWDKQPIEPNCIYVCPAGSFLSVELGFLRVFQAPSGRIAHYPIDFLFNSMAGDLDSSAIGIVLSGNDSDGSLGLQAIRDHGGLAIVQSPESAKFDSMPRSAIDAGAIDFISAPRAIADELARLAKEPPRPGVVSKEGAHLPDATRDRLEKIYRLLMRATGVDFTSYKIATVKRRIKRRMLMTRTQALDDYIELLSSDSKELDTLFDELLINVTQFFRDPEVFEALRDRVFPDLIRTHDRQQPIRVWVPGCSTGEEVYSLAIALMEYLDDKGVSIQLQIFATDIDERAIEKARIGLYPKGIEAHVGKKRLERYFTPVEGGFQISPVVREQCVFARQDITRDPPFARLDLVSCRNLLIYLDPNLQKRVMSTFFYSLKPSGYLLLGRSESTGDGGFYSLVDKLNKIYQKKSTANLVHIALGTEHFTSPKVDLARRSLMQSPQPRLSDARQEADRIIFERYAPAGVLVGGDMQILQFRGRTGPYLELPSGDATLNLMAMARQGLIFELRSGMNEAARSKAPVVKKNIEFESEGSLRRVDLEFLRLDIGEGASHFLVLFHDASEPVARNRMPGSTSVKSRAAGKASKADELKLRNMKDELKATKEYLQSVVSEQVRANQELQAANEEIVTANEELQSTNEELETAKEELQSTNEELTTVNEEFLNRNQELATINGDLLNLLNCVSIPILMLGSDIKIRRYTPQAERLLQIIPTDIGRPLTDLRTRLKVEDLHILIREAIDSISMKELEVQDDEGRWYRMIIRPCKTPDNRIDGAVVAWIDIDDARRNSQAAREGQVYSDAIFEMVREPLVVLDADLRVVSANRAFYRTFHALPGDTEGGAIFDIGNGQWNIPELRTLLVEILSKNMVRSDYRVSHDFRSIGRKEMVLNARRLEGGYSGPGMILLAIEIVAER